MTLASAVVWIPWMKCGDRRAAPWKLLRPWRKTLNPHMINSWRTTSDPGKVTSLQHICPSSNVYSFDNWNYQLYRIKCSILKHLLVLDFNFLKLLISQIQSARWFLELQQLSKIENYLSCARHLLLFIIFHLHLFWLFHIWSSLNCLPVLRV